MSVSDLITDLPPCSPLISDGFGHWKGHGVVLWELTQIDSVAHANPISNCVSHSQMLISSLLFCKIGAGIAFKDRFTNIKQTVQIKISSETKNG